jgi:hypothetical protein
MYQFGNQSCGDTKAITEAVKKLMASTELHDKLWENGNYLKDGLVFLFHHQ